VGGIIRFAGREADTTVAHHQGGNTVVGSRAAQGIPGGLAIHVRVHVDPPGGEQFPRGVYLAPGRTIHCADGGDFARGNCQITAESGFAGAVHNSGVANNEIVHGSFPYYF
jgi:hypothetical protein